MPIIVEEFWQSIETTAVAGFVKDSVWAYPALETVHIIGLGLVFGAIVAFDLRVLGLNKSISVSRLGQHLLPWVWLGFFMNAMSGVLLFASDAGDFSNNPALQTKLFLILLAGINAAVFRTRVQPSFGEWDADRAAPRFARTSAGFSIALWIAIVVAGRMIAYVK